MSDFRPDYLAYRLSKASESLADARILAAHNSWNSCVNRLYYACYYAASALAFRHGINTQTHSGLINQFSLHFVKPGKISKQYGKLYADLMDWRQKGDYGDLFDFEQATVEPLIVPVEEFLKEITALINKSI